ncbi:MAG: hypothetical protein R2728_04800 [Chitinophagales bacterium]
MVPMHYDDFTLPLTKGLKTTNLLFNWKMGANLGKAFEIIESNNKARSIKVMPLWEPISIHQLLE